MTFPRAYHVGFSHGNFFLDWWNFLHIFFNELLSEGFAVIDHLYFIFKGDGGFIIEVNIDFKVSAPVTYLY